MKLPWYSEGLAFECQGCGKCCKGPGGYVWISEEDLSNMAAELKMSEKEFARKYVRNVCGDLALIDKGNGDCVFLDDSGKCELYHSRPVQCRTFPWWPEIVNSRYSWENSAYDCPGFNMGPVHSLEEIEKGLKEKTD